MMGRNATAGHVEIRENSLRISFQWQGTTCRETVKLNGAVVAPTAANVKFATRLAATVQAEIKAGVFSYGKHFPDSPRATAEKVQTFGELAAHWFASKGQLEAATQDQYRNAIAVWETILGKDTGVPTLTYQYLASKIGAKEWASGKSANNYLIVLRGIMGFEFNGAKAALNPMVGIKNLKHTPKPADPLTASERDAILDDMRKHYDVRVWAYFAWAFSTGMRPEEIIALRWSSIDFRSETARVERVRTFKGSERDGAKTSDSERDVDLVPLALDALTAMKPYTFMKGTDADIFEHPVLGKPWHDERSQRDTYWVPTLRRLGIRQRRAYATRHTYATVALMGGVNPAYVARQMGHSDTKMFFGTYTKWIDGADNGIQKAAMAKAMHRDISLQSPSDLQKPSSSLENLGRRDWTRTNKAGSGG